MGGVQNQTFPDTVTVLKAPNGSVVYLVGTAHFSVESQEDVAEVCKIIHIQYAKYNNLCIISFFFICI